QRRHGRRAPAAPADLALRLLLRHSDWWERLGAEDHELLHGLGGDHGAVTAWLERQLVEHGPQTWAALEQSLADEPFHGAALAWVNAAAPDEEQTLDDLRRVMHQLWIHELKEQSGEAAAAAVAREDFERLRSLNDQIKSHLQALVALAA
ncbi:MAG: DNA primase, partial [Burkholderiales bacterium]|nr:DNA primase [Burkholderiales bacterium]